jgi:hypothetical protein
VSSLHRRIPLALLLCAGVSACATEGAGGGAGFLDCETDDCVGYDDAGLRRLYIRTPAGAAGAPRGRVTTVAGRDASTQVVMRGSVALPGTSGASRMGPIPARPTSPSPGGGRRP